MHRSEVGVPCIGGGCPIHPHSSVEVGVPFIAPIHRPIHRFIVNRLSSVSMARVRCECLLHGWMLEWVSLHYFENFAMGDRDLFGEISGRLTGLLQSGGAAAGDLRGKIEQQLRDGVAELSAINREEFDAQARALERAEERIRALEETVAALEQRIAQADEPSAKQ